MKTPFPVDRKALKASILAVESNGPKSNRTALYEEVANHYNAAVNPAKFLTHSVVGLRIKEWKLTVETPVGKRGRSAMTEDQKAAMAAGRGNRRGRGEKFAANNAIVSSLNEMEKNTPERFLPIVEKIKAGSMSAAVRLHCLECSGFVTSEVRNCVCTSCALFAFRPYQGAVEVEEAVEVEAEAA